MKSVLMNSFLCIYGEIPPVLCVFVWVTKEVGWINFLLQRLRKFVLFVASHGLPLVTHVFEALCFV